MGINISFWDQSLDKLDIHAILKSYTNADLQTHNVGGSFGTCLWRSFSPDVLKFDSISSSFKCDMFIFHEMQGNTIRIILFLLEIYSCLVSDK